MTFPVALSIFLLVGIVVGGLGGLSGLVFGAIFIAFLPLWAQGQDLGSLLPDRIIEETQKPGGPAIVYGVVLILLMFVLPNGVGGLFRRIGQLDHESPLLSVESDDADPTVVAVVSAARARSSRLPVAFAGSAADPGVSPTTILIGGTSPLTGPAASYASVARGAKAYFDSINAKGGVAKRKIDYRIVDDAYNPALTVHAVRRLVEQDKVFAVFNTLGTESNLSIRDYLNQSKVPQLFVASGATTWGATRRKYPWTIGFQPSYAAEGFVYGQYVAKTQKKAKIGVLFQNDDYGKDLLGGLKSGLGRSGSKVVAARAYEVTSPDVGSQIAKLKASGANVLAIFATPTFAIQAYVFANRLGWRPLVHPERRLRDVEHHGAGIRGREEQGGRGNDHEHDPQGPDRPALEERPRHEAVPRDPRASTRRARTRTTSTTCTAWRSPTRPSTCSSGSARTRRAPV